MNPAERATAPVHRLPDDEIERLLVTGERRQELVAVLGEDAYRELRRLARRAAATRVRSRRPVYVLPGLMGSRIGTRGRIFDDVLWVDVIEIAAGHLVRLALPRGANLVALGAMWLNALKLKLSLQVAGFGARFHAFDWRLGIEPLALELVQRLEHDDAHGAMLVGHSMGGVVARAALAQAGDRVSRVVQIGAPNFGSYAPVLALRAVYPTVRKLAALDRRHSAEDYARLIFRTLPSLHELLPSPLRSGDVDLFDVASWPDDELRPDRAMLSAGAAAQLRWPRVDARCLHIVGMRQETVTSVRRRGDAFEFVVTADGDGTVPLSMAVLPGSRVWYAAEKHGGLPNNGRVIAAVVDLLRSGATTRLPTSVRRPLRAREPARSLSEANMRRVAPHKVRWQDLSPDARRRLLEPVVSPEFHGGVASESLRSASPDGTIAPVQRKLELRLTRRSVTDTASRALVLGTFRNVDPSGAAAAGDRRLGGAVRELTLRRMFGGQLGQVFMLPTARSALPVEFVLFVGLGDFDAFSTNALAFAAENAALTLLRARVEEFTTVPMGAGSGVSVADALEAQVRGVLDALRRTDTDQVVRRVTICEIDARKYRSLCTAAARLARDLSDPGFTLGVDREPVRASPARAQRAAIASKRADPVYLLVNLLEHDRASYESRTALLTAGAKAGVLSGQRNVSRSELHSLLAPLSEGAPPLRDLRRIGERLARLLLAGSVAEGLADMRSRPLVIVHDREASQVPWELLHDGDGFPALGAGLSRRYASDTLTAARWRAPPVAGGRVRVLVVADPTGDLPSAAQEGTSLKTALETAGVEVRLLLGGQATRARILDAIDTHSVDALHFAGHGFFESADPAHGGLVCAGGEILHGSDLDRLGELPALVFFNACEAARVRRRGAPGSRSRRAARVPARGRASSVAEAFLAGGVANFIGTHWPVGDAAAGSFSTGLYTRLLGGADLGTAIVGARRALSELGLADWADYVHYGNPAFMPLASRNGPD